MCIYYFWLSVSLFFVFLEKEYTHLAQGTSPGTSTFISSSIRLIGHLNVDLATHSFAFLEGKAFRHGDIVSSLDCASGFLVPHAPQEDSLGEVAKKAGGFALGALIGKGGSKFSGLDIKRVYFGCVLMSSRGWIAISHRAAVSQELVERLQSGSEHMRSHYFRPFRLRSARIQAVDVAGLQKLQIQVRAYMQSCRKRTSTHNDLLDDCESLHGPRLHGESSGTTLSYTSDFRIECI